MATHELKSWSSRFQPIWDGRQNFDIRNNDRKFEVGDILIIREFDENLNAFLTRSVTKRVIHIVDGKPPLRIVLGDHYVVLSFVDA